MSKDKIKDNPSYKKLNEEIAGAAMLGKIAKGLSKVGLVKKEFAQKFDELEGIKKEVELITTSPDEFNKLFSSLGWIAHESINSDLMHKAIELGKEGKVEEAETLLVEYYTADNLHLLIHPFKGIEAFRIRYGFFLKAIDDTRAGRYYSAVPLMLMMLDGVVNDISKSKGFFAEGTDLTAWDSIAAHSSGLSVLKDILNKGRNKTTTEEIDKPYRNGILHGRDLGYANSTVTAKCWAASIALRDWAKALQEGKGVEPEQEPKLGFRDGLQEISKSIKEYGEHRKRMDVIHKKIHAWKARDIKLGIDMPIAGSIDEYDEFSPEREAVQFIDYWKSSNYGKIAKQIHHIGKSEFKKDVILARQIFENRRLLRFAITEIKDCAPAVTEVYLDVEFEYESNVYKRNVKLRFIFEDEKGDTLIIGDKKGRWGYLDFFFSDIEFAHLQQ
jgi:hypothetical protein